MIGVIGNENQVAGFGLVGIRSYELQKKSSIKEIEKVILSWKDVEVCLVPIHLKDELQTLLPDMFFIAIPTEKSTQDINKLIKETLGIKI